MKEVFINERRITYGNRNARTRPLFKLIELYKLIQKAVQTLNVWTAFFIWTSTRNGTWCSV